MRKSQKEWSRKLSLFLLLFVFLFAVETQVHAFSAWSKENGVYVNDKGAAIPGAVKKGIDVSRYQGLIDWNKVKASDVEFVIIRCGVGTDMVIQDDPYWKRNVEACEKLGIPYGVYLYSYADTVEKAQSEAKHVLRLLKGHKPSYPIYYDREDITLTKLTPAQHGQIAKVFCTEVEKTGYRTGVYSSKNWFETELTDSYFNTKEKWVAHHESLCDYKGTYGMWQATAKGRVSGIIGNVDINFQIEKAPARVNLKAASTAYNRQKLIWNKASGAAGYEVYRSTSSGGKYDKIKTTTGTSLMVSAVTGHNYYYKVRAFKNVNGGKLYGSFSPVRKVKSSLSRPTLKSVKRISSKKVLLKWKKVDGASGYQIYYSRKKGSGYKKLATVKKGKTTSCKVSVKKGKRYYYKIRAYRKAPGITSYSSDSKVKSCK